MTDTRKNRLLRTMLFSGLGIFACLLLGNYTNLPPEAVARLGIWWVYLFFIVIFNLLGEVVVRMSVWLNNQYLLGGRRRLRLVLSYAVAMLLMYGINYVLLVSAKLLAGAASPFTFPNGGVRILILVWLVELVVLGLLSANYSMRETLRLQRLSAALQEETDAARYTALQQQLDPHFLFNSLNTLIAEIEYDPVRAVTFTRNLSDVYRYVLQSQHKRLVTLARRAAFRRGLSFPAPGPTGRLHSFRKARRRGVYGGAAAAADIAASAGKRRQTQRRFHNISHADLAVRGRWRPLGRQYAPSPP